MSIFPQLSHRYARPAGVMAYLLAGTGLAAIALGGVAWAAIPATTVPDVAATPDTPLVDDPDQVQFAANTVAYDELTQTITAEGKVEIAQDGKILRAQKIVYQLNEDKAEAVGDVVMVDKSGDVHFAERVELERRLKNGYIKKLRSVLADGSRFTAEEGRRIAGDKTEMTSASYTPCEPCKKNPEEAPVWQIIADKVMLDEKEHSVTYDNARFEVYGVPVAYTPYFVHPDGTIKQKSGVLAPKFSLNSQLGFGVASSYYWAIDPSQDATIGARIFTKENPLLFGEYRRRFDDAEIKLNSSATYSDSDDEVRGHLFGEGIWEIDERLRAGFRTQLTTDDRYLRRYDISTDNILENELYIERFDDRDYQAVRAIAYQDIRTSDRSTDQPNILPEFVARFFGDPNGFLGGRWDITASLLDVLRKGNGQDVLRTSLGGGWQRRDVTGFGLVNQVSVHARADAYHISDRDEVSIVGGDGGAHAFRFYPVIQDEISYPLVKNNGSYQVIVEPKISITASTHSKNDTDVPNEDSQDVQIDSLNIFDENRFPGIDRVEDKSHVTYGLRTGIYDDTGSMGEIFLGQSFRLDDDTNPFPRGSGLSEQESDIVGDIIARYRDQFSLNYKFQLGASSLKAERHEFDGSAEFGNFTVAANYFYLRGLDGTDLTDSRQQLYGSIAYHIDEEWEVSTAARYDFKSDEEGLRYTDLGLLYTGQCASIGLRGRRTFTYEDTGDNATEITLQVGLKNLGSVGTDE